MALRLLITDAVCSTLEPLLRESKHAAGAPPRLSDRMFIEAVLYQARTGTPWRDLPDEFGHWNAVYQRFRRWEKRHLWARLWQQIQQVDDEPLKEVFIDSTIVRAHQHAAGAVKNGGQEAQALGRSRGGFSTKLHVACANETTGVSFVLTGGERHDGVRFELLWKALPSSPAPEAAVMDKAYDSKGIRQVLADQGVEAVIPARSNRTETIHHDQEKDKRRQQVERFFNKLKQFRRIAIRYDKLARTVLAFVHIVSAWIMLRSFVNTP